MSNFFLKRHKLALFYAAVIGIICVAPHALFKISLGEEYKGIYMTQTANEVDYVSRIQEMTDGHFKLGSVLFFEYKDSPPLMPPNIFEAMVFGINQVFGISVLNVIILSKFFLPVFLFLLIYFLTYELTEKKELIGAKINAIAGGSFTVLGYDLVDYRSILNYLNGKNEPNDFLIWTRPSNPILGALLIFSFLLTVWFLYERGNFETKKYASVFLSGLLLTLAFMSYFFSWGIILSFAGALFVINMLKREYGFAQKLIFIVLVAFVFSLPYFYNIFTAVGNSSYRQSALSIGLFLNHKPIMNKFLIFSLLMFLIFTLFNKENIKKKWWVFSFTFIISGFIAFNQQIITGRTVWPFHFVQYTIPLSIIALFVIFFNVAADKGKKLLYVWFAVMIFTAVSSLFFGIYVQASTYKQSYSEYKNKQKYHRLFNWINANTPKDCVILAENDVFLNRAIPAFTHCNVYAVEINSFLIPLNRIYHNYFTYLRLKDVMIKDIDNYLNENGVEAAVYLYGTEGLIYGDLSPSFVSAKNKIASEYKEFLKKDFNEDIKRYKLDYIITAGKFSNEGNSLIKNLNAEYSFSNFKVYKFK